MAAPFRDAAGRYAHDSTAAILRANLFDSALSTARTGAVGTHRGVAAMVASMQVSLRSNSGKLTKVNQQIAKKMHEGVIKSYGWVEKSGSAPYRAGQNRLPGALGKVIRSPGFVRADAKGIDFGDTSALDKQAKHWRRLNFGTASRSTPPKAFRLEFDGATVATLRLSAPSLPDPKIPFGFFLHAGRGGVGMVGLRSEFKGAGTLRPFFPAKGQLRWHKTVGIRSRHYLDAGLAAMQREMPRRYKDFMDEQISQGTKAGRSAQSQLVKADPKNPLLPV